MKVLSEDIESRLVIKVDKQISPNSLGVLKFGENNDYPNLIERIIQSSVTAKNVRNVYARFLAGQGFENEAVNMAVIAKDVRGKDVTVADLLRKAAISVATFNGVYIKVKVTESGEIANPEVLPFKNCRFFKPDDSGYIAKVAYHENWPKYKDVPNKFDKNDVREYYIFNMSPSVMRSQAGGSNDLTNHPGMVYFQAWDDEYIYPLSPFDPVYLDADSEWRVSVYQNNEVRSGFMLRHIMRVKNPETEEDKRILREKVASFQGPDGNRILLLSDDIDPETGDIRENGAFRIDKVDANINDELFDIYDAKLSNRIRKAANALPQILIEYESSQLGAVSGEAIAQAVEFYNAMTSDDRAHLSRMFKDIFQYSNNDMLKNNADWTIKKVELR